MWLKKGMTDRLLLANNLTREGLSRTFGCSVSELNLVLDGKMETGLELEYLLIRAFGIKALKDMIDWEKTGESN